MGCSLRYISDGLSARQPFRLVTTFRQFIKLLIIRTILGPAPWSLAGGVQAPGVALAYLEHVSLAQGGGKGKNKGQDANCSLLGGERLTPVQTSRRFHNTKAYFSFYRFSCSSQVTPLNSNLFSSLSCRLIPLIRPDGARLATPALLVPAAAFSEVTHNRSGLPPCSYRREHLFPLHFPTVGCDRATSLGW